MIVHQVTSVHIKGKGIQATTTGRTDVESHQKGGEKRVRLGVRIGSRFGLL